jgi:hypothetical protein
MKKFLLAASSSAALVMASPAAAATLIFDFVGNDAANSFNFEIDSNPTPLNTNPGGFEVGGISVTFAGGAETSNITFYNTLGGGGLDIFGTSTLLSLAGSTLFTNGEATPMLTPGVFDLNEISVNAPPGGTPFGTLTVSLANQGAVPEPGTWMLMILGFGAIGASMRRGKSQTRFSISYS